MSPKRKSTRKLQPSLTLLHPLHAQEFVRGPLKYLFSSDLWTILYRGSPRCQLLLPDLFQIIYDIADALEYLHSCSICHCDLTPKNILVDEGFGAHIIDFGCSKRHPVDTREMHGKYVQGCVSYLAPEVLQGNKHSPKSDVYSLGVIITELLTQVKPWDGYTDGAIEHAVCNQGKNVWCMNNENAQLGCPLTKTLNKRTRKLLNKLMLKLLATGADGRPSAACVKADVAEIRKLVDKC